MDSWEALLRNFNGEFFETKVAKSFLIFTIIAFLFATTLRLHDSKCSDDLNLLKKSAVHESCLNIVNFDSSTISHSSRKSFELKQISITPDLIIEERQSIILKKLHSGKARALCFCLWDGKMPMTADAIHFSLEMQSAQRYEISSIKNKSKFELKFDKWKRRQRDGAIADNGNWNKLNELLSLQIAW